MEAEVMESMEELMVEVVLHLQEAVLAKATVEEVLEEMQEM